MEIFGLNVDVLTHYGGQLKTLFLENLHEKNPIFYVGATCIGLITLAHVLKKKAELLYKYKYNLKTVHSNILYNYPILGHCLAFPSDPVLFWNKIGDIYDAYRSKFPSQHFATMMFGPFPLIVALTPESTEKMFKSVTNIYKGQFYSFLLPWFKTGLLTSHGAKWKHRRAMLTPAFHKHVLEDYLETMNEKADIMIRNIKDQIKTTKNNIIEAQHFVTLCALDIIVETAMGKVSDLQSAGENEYVNAVYSTLDLVQKRQKSIWLWPDTIFNNTADGMLMKENLDILLSFTRNVIHERWTDYHKQKQLMGSNFETEYFGEAKSSRKRRLSFLDTLLYAMDKDKSIDMDGCCEEVDTFMFEGHDTTSAGMTWAIQEIGNNQEVLRKCIEEVDEVFGDSDRPASIDDLNRLVYVEACIKEALRKFPSVPIFGREITNGEEVTIGQEKYILPKGALFVFPVFYLQRDPKYWKNPDVYNPDRFMHGNADKRYAYSYTPFSAGSRNCIGQKFAIMEEKVIVSKLLRNFEWVSEMESNSIPVIAEIITRPKNGSYIKLLARN